MAKRPPVWVLGSATQGERRINQPDSLECRHPWKSRHRLGKRNFRRQDGVPRELSSEPAKMPCKLLLRNCLNGISDNLLNRFDTNQTLRLILQFIFPESYILPFDDTHYRLRCLKIKSNTSLYHLCSTQIYTHQGLFVSAYWTPKRDGNPQSQLKT